MDKFTQSLKTFWSKTNRFHRVLIVFAILEIQPFPRGKLGFYCNDPKLSHLFKGDTIDWKWLTSVCGLLPLAVMLIVEKKYHNTDKNRPNKRALRWYKEYMFGYLLNLCIVQMLKCIIGSPRPHFFDTCSPKEASTCNGSEYISSYTCSKAFWPHESDKSFPSGHTSLGIHAGLFIAYYLHKRTPTKSSIIRGIKAVSIAAAVWCAGSRMMDHRHHWWDVLAGAHIGMAVLFYTTHRLCRQFECSTNSDVVSKTSHNEDNTKVTSTT